MFAHRTTPGLQVAGEVRLLKFANGQFLRKLRHARFNPFARESVRRFLCRRTELESVRAQREQRGPDGVKR